jgi:hypothetical protein
MELVSSDEIRGTGKRRILYGHILTFDDGTKIYMAQRKNREVFRNGKITISGAMSEEVAAWAIDEDLLIKLRVKGVTRIGVNVIDTGDQYLTDIKTFFNPKTSALKDYTGVGKGGSKQRYVKMQHFDLVKGIVKLDDSKLY